MSDFFALMGGFLAIVFVLVAIAFGILVGCAVIVLLFKLCTKKGRASLKKSSAER